MVDLKRTLSLIRGGIFDSEQTWRSYLPEADNWQKTALLLTGPLIVFAAVGAYVFGFLGSDVSFFGRFRPTIVSTILTMITSAIAAGVVAFAVSALAGAFGGKNSFALGLAATTFAFIPGYIGQAVAWLPLIGGLLAFGLFIYGHGASLEDHPHLSGGPRRKTYRSLYSFAAGINRGYVHPVDDRWSCAHAVDGGTWIRRIFRFRQAGLRCADGYVWWRSPSSGVDDRRWGGPL